MSDKTVRKILTSRDIDLLLFSSYFGLNEIEISKECLELRNYIDSLLNCTKGDHSIDYTIERLKMLEFPKTNHLDEISIQISKIANQHCDNIFIKADKKNFLDEVISNSSNQSVLLDFVLESKMQLEYLSYTINKINSKKWLPAKLAILKGLIICV